VPVSFNFILFYFILFDFILAHGMHTHGPPPVRTDQGIGGQGLEEADDARPVHAADRPRVVPVRRDSLAVIFWVFVVLIYSVSLFGEGIVIHAHTQPERDRQ
jgi:hypothetical protein